VARRKARADLPVAPLPDLMQWLDAQQVPALIIGGLAVALLGRPRVTRDIDILVLLDAAHWQRFLAAGKEYGFVPRLPDALAFAQEARVLLLRHERTGVDIDVSLGCLEFEQEAVARGRKVRVAGVRVPLPTPEDLVIMKAIAQREQDLLDIDGLVATHPRLDTRRIRRWARTFAEALEAPDLYRELDRRLRRRRGRSK
jgi:hypothetical protein